MKSFSEVCSEWPLLSVTVFDSEFSDVFISHRNPTSCWQVFVVFFSHIDPPTFPSSIEILVKLLINKYFLVFCS